MSINNTLIAIALKSIRTEKGISAKDLSIRCNYPEYTVGRIEREQLSPNLLTIYSLIKGLGVSMDEFISTAESMIGTDKVEQLDAVNKARSDLKKARNMLNESLSR